MKKLTFSFVLAGCVVLALTGTHQTRSADRGIDESLRREISKIAQIRGASPDETFRQHNRELNRVFQQYARALGGEVSGPSIRHFHRLVTQSGLTCFDDFCAAMIAPLRYVKDPASNAQVPVFGPLGSDIINPWMAAVGVAESRPLDEQPMYNLAADVLREHIDFALVGIKDPNLSIDMLPPELRENARWAYRRLNPTNKFDGGFDHPLFYVTIREAAKKLFREDYPAAKLTMADLVVSQQEGGFGIQSCLLCHNRDYAGVYSRLIAQSRFYQAKANELRGEHVVFLGANSAVDSRGPDEAVQAEATAEMFELAARRVLAVAPDKIDPEAVRASLETPSPDNVSRLMPGYDEFYDTLDAIGCTMCHRAGENPSPERNPAKFDAFVLDPNEYFKTKNISALLSLIDFGNLSRSKLLAKAEGAVNHRGTKELELDEDEIQQLRDALYRWINSLELRQTP